jgi:hypothetical protein
MRGSSIKKQSTEKPKSKTPKRELTSNKTLKQLTPKVKPKSKTDTKTGVPLDTGGRQKQTDRNTGEEISTTPESRKMFLDAKGGTVNPKLTGNVVRSNDGVYATKPYSGEMLDYGRVDDSGKFFPTTGGKGSPGHSREQKTHIQDSTNYMRTATRNADRLNRYTKNAY